MAKTPDYILDEFQKSLLKEIQETVDHNRRSFFQNIWRNYEIFMGYCYNS